MFEDLTIAGTTVHAIPVGHGDAIVIVDGVLDAAAREAFTKGQCHAFAVALRAATGWDVVAIISPADWMLCSDLDESIIDHTVDLDGFHLGEHANHFACMRPDGLIVDIEGVHTVAEFYARWRNGTAYVDPVWGVSPTPDQMDLDDPTQVDEYVNEDWSDRLVKVVGTDAQILGTYPRRATPQAAAAIVPALLATLDPLTATAVQPDAEAAPPPASTPPGAPELVLA